MGKINDRSPKIINPRTTMENGLTRVTTEEETSAYYNIHVSIHNVSLPKSKHLGYDKYDYIFYLSLMTRRYYDYT